MAKGDKKPKKPRSNKYDPKLSINGSFDDVMKVFAAGEMGKKDEAKKPTQKK
jgi:hypothetical protein